MLSHVKVVFLNRDLRRVVDSSISEWSSNTIFPFGKNLSLTPNPFLTALLRIQKFPGPGSRLKGKCVSVCVCCATVSELNLSKK